jgi:hypothetical protein
VPYPGPADDAQCNENGGPAVPDVSRIYRGIELTARMSMADRFWIQAWYVYSSLTGNYDGAASLRSGQTDPGINADFDYWQFDRSRTHQGSISTARTPSSSRHLPRPFSLLRASGYVAGGPPQITSSSAKPTARSLRRASRLLWRAATQYERAHSDIVPGGSVSIARAGLVFNLLDRQAETRVADDDPPAFRRSRRSPVRRLRQDPGTAGAETFRAAIRISSGAGAAGRPSRPESLRRDLRGQFRTAVSGASRDYRGS